MGSVNKNKLWGWLEKFISDLPNIVFAAVIFVVFFLAAKYLRKLIYKLVLKISQKPSLSKLFSSIFYITTVVIGLFVSLEILQLEKTISSLLAGAGIIGLALGFAFQDLTANFISGVFIIFKKPFEVGHEIQTNDLTGIVEEIQLRSTVLKTFQGLHIMLPNKDIFQKPLTNFSLSNERRVDVALTLPAKNNIGELEQQVKKAISQLPEISNRKEAEVYFTDYSGDNVKLEVWYWITNSSPQNYVIVRDKIIKLIYSGLAVPEQKNS
jgi:small conductance mechanosensitive channel